MIQAVIFNKKKWTIPKAKKWLYDHGFKPIKQVHETLNYFRYRILPPLKNKSYYSTPLKNGVILVMFH